MGGKRVQPKSKKKRMRTRTKFTILSVFNLTWYAELAILYGIKVKSKEPSDEDAQG